MVALVMLHKIITDTPFFSIIQTSILHLRSLVSSNFHTCKSIISIEYQKVEIFGEAKCSIVTHSLQPDAWQLVKFITTAFLHQTAKWIITFSEMI